MENQNNTYANNSQKLLYLSDDIQNISIGHICYSLICMIQDDDKREEKEKDFTREPIKLYINSHGGSVYDMWALIDIILKSKTPIYTYCTGYAMSAAFNIFLAGHKRFASEHAIFMYHQINCRRSGCYQDLVEDREEMDYLQNTIEEYIISRTKFTEADMKEFREKKRDVFIHSDDVISLGVADEIL